MARIPLPPDERAARMRRGREAFCAGDFYAAHELWEEAWNATDDGPARLHVQGLIQLATALYKLGRGRPDLCARLVAKALERLRGAPDIVDGVDVAAARRGAETLGDALARGESVDGRAVRC